MSPKYLVLLSRHAIMTRPNIETLREQGLICTATKRNGQPCCYKKRPGHEVCARHGAPIPPQMVTPPPTTCECPVCYEVKPAQVLLCKHSLCVQCSNSWFAKHNTCPLCRTVVKEMPASVLRMQVVTSLVTGFLNQVDRIYNHGEAMRDEDPTAALELLNVIGRFQPILNFNRRFLADMAAQR
jgi:hypothetical protein